MIKKLNEVNFTKVRNEHLKKLISEYNKKPQVFKNRVDINTYLEEQTPPTLKIKNNKNIKAKRFLANKKINSHLNNKI